LSKNCQKSVKKSKYLKWVGGGGEEEEEEEDM
jgi:hypothetical protein